MNRLTRSPKNLLPSQNVWDLAASSLAGWWSHWTEPTARDLYRQWIDKDVVRDAVLEQARYGPMRTMALFHNLRDPLFTKYKFDAVEFVNTVAPALEVYQDTLGRLVHEMDDLEDKAETTTADDTENGSSSNMLDVFVTGDNLWRKQAQDNPDSLAGRLSKMTTPGNFDDHYFGAKLFRALAAVGSDVVGGGKTVYVAGSGVVGQVALLHAHVMELEPAVADESLEHPEFAASTDNDDKDSTNVSVAARLDVLYEITQTFAHIPHPLSTSEQYNKSMETASANTSNEKSDSNSGSSSNPTEETASTGVENPSTTPTTVAATDSTDGTTPPVVNVKDKVDEATTSDSSSSGTTTKTETALAVAVLEGWLHGGPDKELRWKIAMIRDAHEFS